MRTLYFILNLRIEFDPRGLEIDQKFRYEIVVNTLNKFQTFSFKVQ